MEVTTKRPIFLVEKTGNVNLLNRPLKGSENDQLDYDFDREGYYLIDDEPYYYNDSENSYFSADNGAYSNSIGDFIQKRVDKYEQEHGDDDSSDDGKDKLGKFLSKNTTAEGRQERKESRKNRREARRSRREARRSRRDALKKAKNDAKIQALLKNKDARPLDKIEPKSNADGTSNPNIPKGSLLDTPQQVINGKKLMPDGTYQDVPSQYLKVMKDGNTYDSRDFKEDEKQVVIKNEETGANQIASVVKSKDTETVKASDGSNMIFRKEDLHGMNKMLKYGLIAGAGLIVAVGIYLIVRKKK